MWVRVFTASLSAWQLQLVSDLPHSDGFCCQTCSQRPPAMAWKGHDWHLCWAGRNERLFMWWTVTSADWAWAIVIRFVWVCLLLGSGGQSQCWTPLSKYLNKGVAHKNLKRMVFLCVYQWGQCQQHSPQSNYSKLQYVQKYHSRTCQIHWTDLWCCPVFLNQVVLFYYFMLFTGVKITALISQIDQLFITHCSFKFTCKIHHLIDNHIHL